MPYFPRFLPTFFLVAGSFLFGMLAFADAPSEQAKIAYLLDAVASSDVVFIRNGSEYTGTQARDHLKVKLDAAGGSILTAEDFITYIASASSVTGSPYRVRMKDGTQLEAEQWLRAALARYSR